MSDEAFIFYLKKFCLLSTHCILNNSLVSTIFALRYSLIVSVYLPESKGSEFSIVHRRKMNSSIHAASFHRLQCCSAFRLQFDFFADRYSRRVKSSSHTNFSIFTKIRISITLQLTMNDFTLTPSERWDMDTDRLPDSLVISGENFTSGLFDDKRLHNRSVS